ncbi:MAG: 1,2-phenylacetyl-CoA epoxidase subunit A [Ignavibacteria bacterium GWA2_55_11]|nr:MAG: 1,2-phenylacetyl-CoA epoxidase subunit A [Ignavibacteria bacterium GWA2_55_11]OGU44627.1 MAG: 1,2-phenylacetyl-CoA epoxidase subunit A [Ignavibacteria bacterium GWC2_56_12]OGU69002.1 MAG: 1,2-phenylacetyl-CoA epoxidase subunit A [Ignavibacteria bacterium RIFCSPLOWO2_02_FULL_55_14]OGU76152.1 MAG: 1,2-phenylacetyl-CoA epoxidase subunit A [Ignavibacteria bacterium RIFCSPLOWO2_12_FULL_56_21]HAV23759.1 1,2-phenylacetyl-CoA epoxidase subunit A [Bacteroidota bacterium]
MAELTGEERLVEFERRIDRGEKVEPGDWMPEDYRRNLIRMISQHAHSEIVGQLPEGKWIPYAPGFRRKLTLIAKVQDEAGHGQLLYRAAETLGKTREEMIDELLSGKAKYANVFNYPTPTWADVGVIGWLVDTAAVINQTMLAQSSYGPYARAMKRICYEESFHIKQGYDSIVTLAKGTAAQRSMAQDAVNRWWYPTLMMSGPPDAMSVHSQQALRWRIKTKSNEQVRQEFVDHIVPQIRALGISVPDQECRLDGTTGHYRYSPPDWEELKRVISGDGPCNKERLEVRRKAHEEGRWVREALQAHQTRKAV